MILRSGFFFIAGLFTIFITYGQDSTNQIVAKILLEDDVFTGEYYSYNPYGANAIFWPENLKQPLNGPDRIDHLIKRGRELLILIDGTNYLYRFSSEGEKPMMIRLDKAAFGGHNFNAFKFCLDDSLYSIGGFGFGHYNGLLLKFEPNASDWQNQLLNKELIVELNAAPGIWSDKERRVIYKIGTNTVSTTGSLESNFSNFSPEVHLLDVKRHQWTQAGMLNSKNADFITHSLRISWHDSGELILGKDASGKRVYLLDYKFNQIRPLKMWASDRIKASFSDSIKDYRGRFLVWHSNDTLRILQSDGILLKHRLSPLEFSAPLGPIWNENQSIIFNNPNLYLLGLFLFGCGLMATAILFTRKHYSKRPIIKLQAESIFNRPELEILQALQSSDRKELLPDQVNELLGTSKKTLEVQKKQRSDTIKGINEKYRRLSNTTDNLILQERLLDDRRQVRYLLSQPAVEKLKALVIGI